jgi:hypothetical protein
VCDSESALGRIWNNEKDGLHFPEQHISLVLNSKKVTSRITMHVARSIHYPSLNKHLIAKEEWNECTWNELAWPSFKIAFNKIPSAQQPMITKMLFSFWCSNNIHLRDRGQQKIFCFYESKEEHWRHILSSPGIGATLGKNMGQFESITSALRYANRNIVHH